MAQIPNKELISDSLDRLAAKAGDPAHLVYDALFETYPGLEALFRMDTDGGVRGSMLAQAFECRLDLAEGGRVATTIIRAERTNHDAYEVPGGIFPEFFTIIRNVTRKVLAGAWTSEHDAAWHALLMRARDLSGTEPVTAP